MTTQNNVFNQKTTYCQKDALDNPSDSSNHFKTKKMLNPYIKWKKQEDVLYIRFLKANIDRMKKTHFKKPYNKFKKMAQYVNTKNSFQCRSHHQKMVKKYGSIQKVIENIAKVTSKFQQLDHSNFKTCISEEQLEQKQKIPKSTNGETIEQQNNNKVKTQKLQIEIKPLNSIQNQNYFTNLRDHSLNQDALQNTQQQFIKSNLKQRCQYFVSQTLNNNLQSQLFKNNLKQKTYLSPNEIKIQILSKNQNLEKKLQKQLSQLQKNSLLQKKLNDANTLQKTKIEPEWVNIIQENNYMNYMKFGCQQNQNFRFQNVDLARLFPFIPFRQTVMQYHNFTNFQQLTLNSFSNLQKTPKYK